MSYSFYPGQAVLSALGKIKYSDSAQLIANPSRQYSGPIHPTAYGIRISISSNVLLVMIRGVASELVKHSLYFLITN